MPKVTFSTAGDDEWTAPGDVTSIRVLCWGAGGTGGLATSANNGGGGGGGSFSETVVEVVPGRTYELFVADPTLAESVSYFDSPAVASATSGKNANGSVGGDGGSREPNTGIPRKGGKGANGTATSASPSVGGGGGGVGGPNGNGGDGGIGAVHFGGTTGTVGGGGGTGATVLNGTNGVAPGGGGGGSRHNGVSAGTPGNGAVGRIELYYANGKTGNGGGGGGGYARKTLEVSPDQEYQLYVGHGGYGQIATNDTNFQPSALRPPLHGESSWFDSPSTLQGAGGRSAGGGLDASEETLSVGAAGGSRGDNPETNVGDVTFVGGNGGEGGLYHELYDRIGGGGGSAGGPDGPGRNGLPSELSGRGGWGSNHSLNATGSDRYDKSFLVTSGAGDGGSGRASSDNGAVIHGHGNYPGGGGGGAFVSLSTATSMGEQITGVWFVSPGGYGASGRVLIRGKCTGRKLLPEF